MLGGVTSREPEEGSWMFGCELADEPWLVLGFRDGSVKPDLPVGGTFRSALMVLGGDWEVGERLDWLPGWAAWLGGLGWFVWLEVLLFSAVA